MDKGVLKQRSKHGCLTCRQKRKKCDEQRPECSRCERTLSQCSWPHANDPLLSGTSPVLVTRRTHPGSYSLSPADPFGVARSARFSDLDIASNTVSQVYLLSRAEDVAPRWASPLAYDAGPSTLLPLGNQIAVRVEDNEDGDTNSNISVIWRSINALGGIYDPDFRELCDFYLVFITRYFYDYSSINHNIIAISQRRLTGSTSARHAMLSLAFLFRSNYDQSHIAPALQKRARSRYQLALSSLQADLESHELSPAAKLTGLSEILTYDYYSGNFSSYYQRLHQTASLVHQVVGSQTLDLMSMSGSETLDVRVFAWCDILGSMAMSRPTLFDYKSDINLVQLAGRAAGKDVGLECIFGCPDVLAVLLARISSLRHSSLPETDKVVEATKIEQATLSWSSLPRVANYSLQAIARLAVQEIWRHTTFLYIHQAIYGSNSSHHMVKDSVKQIIRITSTFKSGHNPDCFLAVPYFIAGSFAASIYDRYQLRTRLLGCGNEKFLRDLASTLDELWQETDDTGHHVSWSTKQPPTFIF